MIPNRYIVVLRDDDSPDPAVSAKALIDTLGSDLEVIHTYENALKGFSVRVPSGLDLPAALSNDPRVDFIAQDRMVKAAAHYMPAGVNWVKADLSPTALAGNGSGEVKADIAGRGLRDLDRVSTWLMVYGLVNAVPGFEGMTNVINGFSDLILELYGPEAGMHACVAPDVATLPLGLPVSIAAELEIGS